MRAGYRPAEEGNLLLPRIVDSWISGFLRIEVLLHDIAMPGPQSAVPRLASGGGIDFPRCGTRCTGVGGLVRRRKRDPLQVVLGIFPKSRGQHRLFELRALLVGLITPG